MEYLKLIPVFKNYLWGGKKLIQDYNKQTSLEYLAESWELANHSDGQNRIASGCYKNNTLETYIEKEGWGVLGKNAKKFSYFPILVKFIDTKENLSVQVHPNDEYALQWEKEYGKTEVWFILEAMKESYLYYGFNKEVTKEEIKKCMEEETFLEILKKVPVKKGDVVFLESGSIHSISQGITLLEIQQNSNITYRLYDFQRVGLDGKPRALHIEKALDVSVRTPLKTLIEPCLLTQEKDCRKGLVSKCEYFDVSYYEVDEKFDYWVMNESFKSITFVNGQGTIKSRNQEMEFVKGDTFFIPAGFGRLEIIGECAFVSSGV